MVLPAGVEMTPAEWDAQLLIPDPSGPPGNYTGAEYIQFEVNKKTTLLEWLKRLPMGQVRPTSPALGEVFLLHTGQAWQLLICAVAGIWTEVDLEGGNDDADLSHWVRGYTRQSLGATIAAGQFKPLVGDTRWAIHLAAGDTLLLAVGDTVRFYNAGDWLQGTIVDAATNAFNTTPIDIALTTVTHSVAWPSVAGAGYILAKVGQTPLPSLTPGKALGAAMAGSSGYWADGEHQHPSESQDAFDISTLETENQPALGDLLALYDTSASAMRKASLTVIRALLRNLPNPPARDTGADRRYNLQVDTDGTLTWTEAATDTDTVIYKGAWAANTAYVVGDIVVNSNAVYLCKTANSDAVFTDSNWFDLTDTGTDTTYTYSAPLEESDGTVSIRAATNGQSGAATASQIQQLSRIAGKDDIPLGSYVRETDANSIAAGQFHYAGGTLQLVPASGYETAIAAASVVGKVWRLGNATYTIATQTTIGASRRSYTGTLTGTLIDSGTAAFAERGILAHQNDLTFTAADETKLDGIEAGAEVNVQSDFLATSGDAYVKNRPPHTVKFAGIDANTDDNIQDSQVGIYNGATQIQATNINAATQLFFGTHYAALGTDATQPLAVLNAVDVQPFFHDHRLTDGDYTVAFSVYGGTEADTVYYLVRDTQVTIDGWVCTVDAVIGSYTPVSSGVSWNIVTGDSLMFAKQVIGQMARAQLPGDVVYREQLAGHETDKFASYNNAFVQNSYRAGDFVLTTDTTGPPTQANQVRQPDIATGSGLFVIGRLRTDADPDTLVWSTVPAATDLASGQTWYASIDGDKGSHLEISITADGTLVGTGTAAYVYAPATWTETGNIADVADFGDYFRLGLETPSDLPVEIPASDVLGLQSVSYFLTLD